MPDYEKGEGYSNRGVEIMKAALPYLGYEAQKSLQIIVQFEELIVCMNRQDDPSELSACGLNGESIDIEAMLLHIKEICSAKEQELINKILNYIQMFRMFQMYQSFMATRSSAEKEEGGEEGNPIMDFFMSQLPPEQKENFENMRMMMSVMNMN